VKTPLSNLSGVAWTRPKSNIVVDFVFFLSSLVQLFADFQFLAKLLVKEVPQVTERTNEVIITIYLIHATLCNLVQLAL